MNLMMILSFLAVILLSLGLAVFSKRGHETQGSKEFFVATGQFGAVLFFFLSVGETYSIATMLAFPGGVFANGDKVIVWFFGYVLLAISVVYLMGPLIWKAGRHYGAATFPDFFRAHFNSRVLELVMALLAIILLVPIGTTQFVGIKLVIGSLGIPIPPTAQLIVAGIVAFSYVIIAGLRSSAFVAILKDILMLGAIVVVGSLVFFNWDASGVTLTAAKAPSIAKADSSTYTFAISTMLLQAVGFAMIPQTWAFVLSARSPAAIRKAQVIAPLYLVMYPLLMGVAYYAKFSGMELAKQDLVFIAVAEQMLPGWLFGVVLAAITLAGLVMLSAVCLAISPLVTRNIVPGLESSQQKRWAAIVTAAYLILSIIGTQTLSDVLVTLNNIFYFGIAQMLPALLAAFCLPRVRASGLLVGMAVGCVIALTIHWVKIDVGGLNPGLVGLVVNLILVFGITKVNPNREGRTIMQLMINKASCPVQHPSRS